MQVANSSAGAGGAARRYEIREQIARGGMGVVYRVHDRVSGEARALKRLVITSPEHEGALRAAFEREYRVLSGLDHPRIIRVYDYAVDADGPYYVMELLDGRDLRSAVPMSVAEACSCLRDVAASLALLHARRLVHRDLSPSNVRVFAGGRAKLLDFGALSDFGRNPHVVGTAPMIAPEVLAGAPLDARVDLYALGALAFFCLTGRHAYPARSVRDLFELFERPPPPLSELVPSVPQLLSELVAELLSRDPAARPASAAEVIVRLDGVLGPADERESEDRQLATSYLQNPRFIGRDALLDKLRQSVEAARDGRGGVVGVRGARGTGRTRLLDEDAVCAGQLGVLVLRVDAGTTRQHLGVARALLQRLHDAVPESRRAGRMPSSPDALRDGAPVSNALVTASARSPIVLQIDNLEQADDASLGVLAELGRSTGEHALSIHFTCREPSRGEPLGLSTLSSYAQCFTLEPFSRAESLVFARTLFGHAPKVDRFAEWMHETTGGYPLFWVELTHRLHAEGEVVYRRGTWGLPAARPPVGLPSGLEDLVLARLDGLGPAARVLAQRVALLRTELSVELCSALAEGDAQPLLAELLAHGVLVPQWAGGFAFQSAALRHGIVERLAPDLAERHHRAIGEVLERLADGDRALAIEAGVHLIAGGADLRGAELVSAQLTDSNVVREMLADLHHLGAAAEAALKVFKRHRRSPYECVPLLAALAQAGFYEERRWGSLYGDEALDVLDQLTGLASARRLMRVLGRLPALAVGFMLSVAAFVVTPRRERSYGFIGLLTHMFAAVVATGGAAAISLDGQRTRRVAELLAPYAALPRFTTARLLYEQCVAVARVPVEASMRSLRRAQDVAERLDDRSRYWLLPEIARRPLRAAMAFALGTRYVYLADPAPVLAEAALLDASGLKLYAMIASQLRYMLHMVRGELGQAEVQRAQVELHAAHTGSAWQVDTWEAAALLPVHIELEDAVALSRSHTQLSDVSRDAPSMVIYRRLAGLARGLMFVSRASELQEVEQLLAELPPRSFIGWSVAMGGFARALNQDGRHAEAKAVALRALEGLREEDKALVGLYQLLEVECAVAEAALGESAAALARLDARIGAIASTAHPLALGALHEARAQIALAVGSTATFEESRDAAVALFRPTRTPQLVARAELLASLGRHQAGTGTAVLQNARPKPAGSAAELTETEQLSQGSVRLRA